MPKNQKSKLLSFLIQYLANPKQVGAFVPSSKFLAIEMAKALNASSDTDRQKTTATNSDHLDLIELGPGTGRITKLLQSECLTLVEIDEIFCKILSENFPEARIVNQSATDFLKAIKKPSNIVSSIPLLNNPESQAIKSAVAALYSEGLINRLVTYSYGLHSPFKDCGFKNEKRFSYALLNIPPATIWQYS